MFVYSPVRLTVESRAHRDSGHDGAVLAVQFDDARIVSGGLDHSIKVLMKTK